MIQIIRFWNRNVYANILTQLLDKTNAITLFCQTLDLLIVVDKNFGIEVIVGMIYVFIIIKQ